MEHFANLDQLVEAVQKYEWFLGTGLDEAEFIEDDDEGMEE
jgi:hypothetical protein